MSFRSLLLLTFFLCAGSAAVSQDKASAPASEASPEPRDTLMRKLNSIIIPTVLFKDATIGEAIEHLRAKSRELDTSPDPAGAKGVNIILRGDGDEPLKAVISLELKDVPLHEALRYVTELAGMKFKVEEKAVLVVPLSEDISEKYTRTFKVPPGFLYAELFGTNSPPLPVGLPLELPWPSSSRIILEAQGVIFPEGASANFNPLTGLLTVTNTQPNLDLVAAFAEVLRKDAPASLAHQLIILEGPGELIRTANAAASRTADAHKELEMLLDYAKNPGSNIRVVADAFMEGRSGVRSTSEAVREHVHATGLEFDAQSRATTAWDMRPLGLSLEIELSMGADGRTLENSLIVKFLPLTPSIRQLTLTEPLTGQPAEFPFSDTAGAEFTTAITSTAGTTKLIGVTKPVGLADQKADVLWAAFLTSTLRRVEMLPPPPRTKVNSDPVPAGMESTTFSAPEGLFDTLMEQEPQPLRQWLENIQGITFPPGAVLEQRGENLHIINTPAMIEAIGALVAHAQNTAPHTLAFTLHTLQAPAGLLRDLTRKSVTASCDDTSMLAAVEAAVQRGEAEFIDFIYLESKSGCRSTYQLAREHSHLSGFKINAKNQPEVEFDMRAVGSSLEIESYLRAEGQTVGLSLSHELHSAPPEARAAHFRDPASGKPFAMPATDFHVLRTSTRSCLKTC
jgi:hypothetical protein